MAGYNGLDASPGGSNGRSSVCFSCWHGWYCTSGRNNKQLVFLLVYNYIRRFIDTAPIVEGVDNSLEVTGCIHGPC